MKKILTASYAMDTPWHVITFATRFAKDHSAAIHGVFLATGKEGVNADYPFPNDLSSSQWLNDSDISESNKLLTDDQIGLFREECDLAGIVFSSEKSSSVQLVIDQSTSSDLFIADTHAAFLHKLLPHIHCPAFLTSGDDMPQQVILMNDSNSNDAIEGYRALLDEFRNLPTCLLSVNPSEADQKQTEASGNLKPYFPFLSFKILSGNTEKEMKDFLAEFSGTVLIVTSRHGGMFDKSLWKTAQALNNICLFVGGSNTGTAGEKRSVL